jgi:hypothetical protein
LTNKKVASAAGWVPLELQHFPPADLMIVENSDLIIGKRVLAPAPGMGYRPGYVRSVHDQHPVLGFTERVLEVQFDAGDTALVSAYSVSEIRTAPFTVGSLVEMLCSNTSAPSEFIPEVWVPAVVDRVNANGTYAILIGDDDYYPQVFPGVLRDRRASAPPIAR